MRMGALYFQVRLQDGADFHCCNSEHQYSCKYKLEYILKSLCDQTPLISGSVFTIL